MLNQCNFIGNVGGDPEIRSTQNGQEIANLSLAVTETWKKDGQKQQKTEWVKVVVYSEGLVNVVKSYVKKGDKLFISGKLQTRKWQDQSGNDRYNTEIVLQGFGGTITMLGGRNDTQAQPEQQEPEFNASDLDDEIPF